MQTETSGPAATLPPIPRHRKYVGPVGYYDILGALQFNVLTLLGLREHHRVLDVGCGSLRLGRLLIPYLNPEGYHGIDPNAWLIEAGLEHEVGHDMVARKQPRFSHNTDLNLEVFTGAFDQVIATSIFSHAPLHLIQGCLQSAARVLSDDGVFVFTYVEGDLDYQETLWRDPGLVTYRPGTLVEAAEAAGLVAQRLQWTHAMSQQWMVVSRQKLPSTRLVRMALK